MRFMNERHGRILRFLKPYIEPYIYTYTKFGQHWIEISIMIETKKKRRLLLFESIDIITR